MEMLLSLKITAMLSCKDVPCVENLGDSLVQLCPTRGSRAACGPVEGFVRPRLGFAAVKVVYILTSCPYFDNIFNLTFLMQVVLSAI